ncbi:MAG: hypothetical protein ACIAQF_09280 [Phycisphaerales bacterium JB065]
MFDLFAAFAHLYRDQQVEILESTHSLDDVLANCSDSSRWPEEQFAWKFRRTGTEEIYCAGIHPAYSIGYWRRENGPRGLIGMIGDCIIGSGLVLCGLTMLVLFTLFLKHIVHPNQPVWPPTFWVTITTLIPLTAYTIFAELFIVLGLRRITDREQLLASFLRQQLIAMSVIGAVLVVVIVVTMIVLMIP